MAKILLVEDNEINLEIMLSQLTSLNYKVDTAINGNDALEKFQSNKYDVILTDIEMPEMNGVEATRQVLALSPSTSVIVLTSFTDDELVFPAIEAGATGYLLKDVDSTQLVEAIRAAARGESILEPSVAAKVIAEFSRVSSMVPSMQMEQLVEPLSERELEILALIARGASNKEISGQLFIAEGTVKNHVTHILGKLDVRDRTQAALKARELGLI